MGINKKELRISGMTTVKRHLPNGKWESIIVIVVPKLSDSFLMSWHRNIPARRHRSKNRSR